MKRSPMIALKPSNLRQALLRDGQSDADGNASHWHWTNDFQRPERQIGGDEQGEHYQSSACMKGYGDRQHQI